jgi:regulator of sirC expression with transglutaminase-like and TPR domain
LDNLDIGESENDPKKLLRELDCLVTRRRARCMKITEERLSNAKVARRFVTKRQPFRDAVIRIALFLSFTFCDSSELRG